MASHEQKRFQLEMARARWAMEVQRNRGATMNITSTRYRGLDGAIRTGFNVFGVDTTRAARDSQAGEPILLNDYPFDTEAEAQEFAKAALVGRKTFYFSAPPGFSKHSIKP